MCGGAQTRGHVGPAASWSVGVLSLQERHSPDTTRHADVALEVSDTTVLPVTTEVMTRINLVEVTDSLDVAWMEDELVRLQRDVGNKGKRNDKEQAEPVECRVEEEMVIAVYVCREPAGLDSRIDSLRSMDELQMCDEGLRELTVYTQMMKISIPNAHHTQLVQVAMFEPLKTVTTMTAAIHITWHTSLSIINERLQKNRTVENSYRYVSQPSVREDGEK